MVQFRYGPAILARNKDCKHRSGDFHPPCSRAWHSMATDCRWARAVLASRESLPLPAASISIRTASRLDGLGAACGRGGPAPLGMEGPALASTTLLFGCSPCFWPTFLGFLALPPSDWAPSACISTGSLLDPACCDHHKPVSTLTLEAAHVRALSPQAAYCEAEALSLNGSRRLFDG